jgi:hypothetical protein
VTIVRNRTPNARIARIAAADLHSHHLPPAARISSLVSHRAELSGPQFRIQLSGQPGFTPRRLHIRPLAADAAASAGRIAGVDS